ncbi:hypothetical protein AB1Y20_023641 [Prymnesium parvum]|uniref:Uncharacterized protein n=1 Tax=Prymnesium parvum TaxID=97485 RepID=A0AB34JHF8_PRYPA
MVFDSSTDFYLAVNSSVLMGPAACKPEAVPYPVKDEDPQSEDSDLPFEAKLVLDLLSAITLCLIGLTVTLAVCCFLLVHLLFCYMAQGI